MKGQFTLFYIIIFVFAASLVFADTFGTGDNQFEIEFVNISGDASSANGTHIGNYRPEGFIEPGYNYRMGTYEITNDQWNKFQASCGTVTGNPLGAYSFDSDFTGSNVPTHNISWLEAVQFVNWLNTSTGHHAAYKFTGTQGTSDYTFELWQVTDAGYNASDPFRNSNAFYFLPTEDEWVKAAYWNGTNLQTYATLSDVIPVAGVDTNYKALQPWNVGSGSEELNGTFDMMGNVWEWMESPFLTGEYSTDAWRAKRGGAWDTLSFNDNDDELQSSIRRGYSPDFEAYVYGFRVASVPEPATLLLVGIGAVMIRRRK